MRPKTLVLFIVAIGCGLVASIGVSQYIEKARGAAAEVETAKIYVATTEISPGERLDAKNISLEAWPKDRIPEGAVADLKDLEEKFSRSRMFKGEPILVAKLADTMDGNYAQSIPEGYRVVAVKVDENSNAGGLVRPGDRVDLVLFLRKSSDIPETGTRTILRDVNVFAVGGQVEREIDKQGASREVRTVSLLVTPKQAESVMLAKELGVLSLSLRRPGDLTEEIGEGVNVQSLLGSDGENANENKGRDNSIVAGPPAQFVTDSAPVMEPAPVEPPPPPAFTMKIRSNNGDHTYVWQALDGHPQEVHGAPPAPSEQPALAPPLPGLQPPMLFPPAAPDSEPADEEAGPQLHMDDDSPPLADETPDTTGK